MPTSSTYRHDGDRDRSSTFRQTVLEDLSRGDFQQTMHRDLQDVYTFYLDDETRHELSQMGKFRRWMYVAYWMLKSSILKLSPTRRLILLGGILLFGHGILGNMAGFVTGFLTLLLVLLLELKDKLLAQSELATGRAVQAALLPHDHPSLPGWRTWLFTRSANEVGGDLVDYIDIDDDRLGIALGDVAGKGLGAALFMAKLQSSLRAIAPNYDDLAELGREMNRIFCRDGIPNRFASLIYLELHPDSGHVRLVNAGHLPPLIIRKDIIEEMPKGAPALGLIDQATYCEQHADLEPGDVLFVYSDGLTEARDEVGRFFGQRVIEQLLEKLRGTDADQMGERLLHAVDRFAGNARRTDDLSMVVLQRVEPTEDAAPASSLASTASV